MAAITTITMETDGTTHPQGTDTGEIFQEIVTREKSDSKARDTTNTGKTIEGGVTIKTGKMIRTGVTVKTGNISD
jgi:hypothetical protein